MRIFQTSVICLLGAGWLASSTPADGQDSKDNSYRDIVGHHSFDLKPAPAAAAQEAQTPPPEIILNGIMTAFGDRSALFKVEPPQAAGRQFYFLSEGERAGGIELLSVDVKAGTIKVRNHDVIQVIALCQPPRLLSIPGMAAPADGGSINLPGNQGFINGNEQTGQTAGGKTPGVAIGQFTQSGYVWSVGIPELPATKSSANNNNNTGSQNTGTANTGTANTGSANSGTADSGTANSGTANTGTANSGTTDSGTANTGIADPGTANTGAANPGTTDTGTQAVEPFCVRASKEFEQLRIQTADAVLSGVDEPLPLTPLTPAGTPAELIGPDQAWFLND